VPRNARRVTFAVLALSGLLVVGTFAAPPHGVAEASTDRPLHPTLLHLTSLHPGASAASLISALPLAVDGSRVPAQAVLVDAGDRVAAQRAAAVAGAQAAAAQRQREAAAWQLYLIAERNRAARAAAAAVKARQIAELNRVSRSALRNPRALGQLLAAQRGWTGAQWNCLDLLWQKESEWKIRADNPSSSAYGIPQALPGSKMSSAGPDWRNNPVTQIKWGLGYIAGLYRTPCSAWAHSQAHNWY